MNFNLKVKGKVIEEEDTEFLNNYTFFNNRKFPDSYINFVKQYGYGLSCDLFLIYIPMGKHPDSWHIRSKEIISTYQDVLDDEENLWFDLEPDVTYQKLKYLIPFAMSENGHYLFWDIDNREGNEFDIYITDFRGIGFTRVASNLYEFFEKITLSSSFKEILPFSQNPLPNTFKPLEKVD